MEHMHIWKPIEGLPPRILDLEKLQCLGDTLEVILYDMDDLKYRLSIKFPGAGRGCFKVTRTYFNFEYNDLLGMLLKKFGVSDQFLYVAEASEYIDRVHALSYGATSEGSKEALKHYMIFTEDAVVEVACKAEPICTLL